MTSATPRSTDGTDRATPAVIPPARRDVVLLGCGLAAGPLFFLIFSIAGAVRPGYDPLRHPVSSLELGSDGWVQAANFLLTGTLVALCGWGLRRTLRQLGGGRTVPVLLVVVGIGLIGAGLFDPDPLSGYPPGTPPTALDPSWHRVLHDLCSTPVFTVLPAACVVMARRFSRSGLAPWAVCSAVSAALMVALFVATSIAFAQGSSLTPVGGLLQRLTLATGFSWLALVAWWSMRHRR